jgi:hypothetical protein
MKVIRSPWLWLGLYVGLIPAFTLVFLRMHDDFRSTTIVAERDFRNLRDQVAAIVAQHAPVHADQDYGVGKSVRLMDDPLLLERTLRVTFAPRYPNGSSVFESALLYVKGEPEGNCGTMYMATTKADSKRFPSVRWEFPLGSNDTTYVIATLDVDRHDCLALRQLRGALEGNPAAAPRNWLRMGYLSVVTVTTLGYGDIVPVTDRARFAIGLEAIVGVGSAGTFFYMLSRSLGRAAPAPAAKPARASRTKGKRAR